MKITIHGTGPADAITVEESALHEQLTLLGVYDPVISLLECLTVLAQTKNEVTKSLKRELAEAAYIKQLAAVRKMCGMCQPKAVTHTTHKPHKRTVFITKEGVTQEEQAELFLKNDRINNI